MVGESITGRCGLNPLKLSIFLVLFGVCLSLRACASVVSILNLFLCTGVIYWWRLNLNIIKDRMLFVVYCMFF